MASIGVLLPVLTGLMGIVVGAWFNAWLTMRRERWNLKRDLYTRLLEQLGETKHAFDRLEGMEANPPDNSEAWSAYRSALMSDASRAADEIRRATSVAAILLSTEAITALKELEGEWTKSLSEPLMFHVFDRRLGAAARAYELVLRAARDDLKLGK